LQKVKNKKSDYPSPRTQKNDNEEVGKIFPEISRESIPMMEIITPHFFVLLLFSQGRGKRERERKRERQRER